MQRKLLIFSIAALLCMIGLTAPAAAVGTVDGVQLVDLAVPFIENQGQLPDEVRYYADTFYGTAYVTDTDLTHAVAVGTEDGTQEVVLKERFLDKAGSAISFTPSGEEPADVAVSYFIGNDPAEWQTGLATYNLVSLGEIYPGTTVKTKARNANIEKLFYVAPGASPDMIRVEILGAEGLRLTDDGNLVVATEEGEVRLTTPKAFQDGQEVVVAYRVLGDDTYGFAVGAYNTDRSLLIDPSLAYSSYLGGSGEDNGWSIAMDGIGNIYLAGYTKSADFPVTEGAFQTAHGGGSYDIVVAKVNADGSGLVYATYLGGDGNDRLDGTNCITVDDAGNAYITGGSQSTNFPVTAGAFQTTNKGSYDITVTKLTADGSGLVYSTYLGGTKSDRGYGIKVDGAGNAYILGRIQSMDFPVTEGAYQTTSGGSYDAVVVKVNADGSGLAYSTYLGGSGSESVRGIEIDDTGNAFIAGQTRSHGFPGDRRRPTAYVIRQRRRFCHETEPRRGGPCVFDLPRG